MYPSCEYSEGSFFLMASTSFFNLSGDDPVEDCVDAAVDVTLLLRQAMRQLSMKHFTP